MTFTNNSFTPKGMLVVTTNCIKNTYMWLPQVLSIF